MTDPAAEAAGAAARILAPDLGPSLPAEVEAALAARDTRQRPGLYLNPVSLASPIVSIATLAWSIYTDQRNRTQQPPRSRSPASSASPCATRTPRCPSAPRGSPRSSGRPTRPGSPRSPPRNAALPTRPHLDRSECVAPGHGRNS